MKHQQQILPAVAAAIFNDQGEVLLQRRRDTDQWCVISGHVEFGETVEAAVLREIEEETTVKASIVRFIGVYSSPDSQTYNYQDRSVQYITTYFEARLNKNIPLHFSNNETKELCFFPPDTIPADLALINAHWLTDALNKKGAVFIR